MSRLLGQHTLSPTRSVVRVSIPRPWPPRSSPDQGQEVEKSIDGSTKENLGGRKCTTKKIREKRTLDYTINSIHFIPSSLPPYNQLYCLSPLPYNLSN
jgi:hypothetical protein